MIISIKNVNFVLYGVTDIVGAGSNSDAGNFFIIRIRFLAMKFS